MFFIVPCMYFLTSCYGVASDCSTAKIARKRAKLLNLSSFVFSLRFEMSRHARSQETMENKRKLEKERRSKKCDLSEDVFGEMYRMLDALGPQEKPKFADIARFGGIRRRFLLHLMQETS
jgi:hypothetical protein